MKFPVELLDKVNPAYLEQSAKEYISELLYNKTKTHDYLTLPESKNVDIGLCNVSLVPLYGADIKWKILALFSPEDHFKAVGLYLMDQWWSAEDILKTADPSRTGLLLVRTLGERIVLYVLNRIIYRTKEMAEDESGFLCHGEDDVAKILWKDGEAIGFYSIKPEGSRCSSSHTQHYQLPVMDTIFIRKCHRRKGYGLKMLKDFVGGFRRECVGLKYPLSPAMYEVCRKYLSTYPADSDRLWEVQGIGSPYQRTPIARKLQKMEPEGSNQRQVMHNLNFDTEDTDEPIDAGITHVMENIEYKELVEEVIQNKATKEVMDTAVTTLGRSSNVGEKTEEASETVLMVKDIESDVQSSVDEQASDCGKHSLNVKATDLKDTCAAVTHRASVSEICDLHSMERKQLTPEFEGSLQEVLDQPTTVMVTAEDALENEQVVQPVPVTDIQSIENNQETHIFKSLGPEELQLQEASQDQQVVEVEIVKMAAETEGIKEQKDEAKEAKNNKDKETYAEILETQKDNEQVDTAENVNTDQVQKENIHDVKEEHLYKLDEEENPDRAHTKASIEKHGDKQQPNYATPVRYSKRVWDEPPVSELTKIVLRSSTKSDPFKQMSPQKTKAVKQQIRSAQQTKATKRPKKPVKASDDHEKKQKTVDVSHTEVAEKTDTSVCANTEEQNDNLITNLKHCVDNVKNVETEYLGDETDDNLMDMEIKLDNPLEENRAKEQSKIIGGEKGEMVNMTGDDQVTAVMAEDDTEAQVKEKSAETFVAETVEKLTDETLKLQKATVMLVDLNKVPPTNTDQNEYTQSKEYPDQETHKTIIADENRQEGKKEDLFEQLEPHIDSTEKEQEMETTESVEIIECMDKNDNLSTEKTGGISGELIKKGAVSKNKDGHPEATLTDEMVKVQEDKLVKECKSVQQTESSKEAEENITEILIEMAQEEEPNEATCNNMSDLLSKDQPAESELNEVSQSCQQRKTKMQQNKAEIAMDNKQQESVNITHREQHENMNQTLSDSGEDVRSGENQYSEQEPGQDDRPNTEEAISALKMQNAIVVLIDLNKTANKTSETIMEVDQDLSGSADYDGEKSKEGERLKTPEKEKALEIGNEMIVGGVEKNGYEATENVSTQQKKAMGLRESSSQAEGLSKSRDELESIGTELVNHGDERQTEETSQRKSVCPQNQETLPETNVDDMPDENVEISDEELQAVITKNLRDRTTIAKSSLQRKTTCLGTQVVTPQRMETELKVQPREKAAVEITGELSTSIEGMSAFKNNFNNENEDVSVVSEVGRYESVTADQQQETTGVEHLAEDDSEHHVDYTTDRTIDQEQDTGVIAEDKELIADNLEEKELDNLEKAGSAKAGEAIGGEDGALEEREEESTNVINKKQFEEKNDDDGKIPITEDKRAQGADGVEQRVLRKRTTNSQATSEIKSKRFCKQIDKNVEEVNMHFKISSQQSILSNLELNKHEDPEMISSGQVIEVKGGENQNTIEKIFLHSTAQEHEIDLAAGSAANLVEETIPQTEKEMEMTDNERSPGKIVNKHDLVKPQEEISVEEVPTVIIKNLRNRTIIAESPQKRKSKGPSTHVVSPQRMERELEAQPREKLAVEITSDLSTAIEEKSSLDSSFNSENEDIYVVCEVGRYESGTTDEQQETTAVVHLAEDAADHVDTTHSIINQEQAAGVIVEDKELIYDNLGEKELENIDKAGSVKAENEIGKESSTVAESKGESACISNKYQGEERDKLRKRMTSSQVASEWETKRFHTKDEEIPRERVMEYTEDPGSVKFTEVVPETTLQEEKEITDTDVKMVAQEEGKTEKELLEEEPENANKGDELKESQEETQQYEKMTDKNAEASVTGEDFTLRLDEELQGHAKVEESKPSHKDYEKYKEDKPDVKTKQVSSKQTSTRRSKRSLQECLSEAGDKSEEEEVKEDAEAEDEKKPQHKRKTIELRPRRSERFAKP